MKRILIISNSYFSSGAEASLNNFLLNYNREKFEIWLVVIGNMAHKSVNSLIKIIPMPLIWFHWTLNPVCLIYYIVNILHVTFSLIPVITRNHIDIIYSNTIKAYIYSLGLKLLTGKKNVWHVRDNLRKGLLSPFLSFFSNKIICASHHICRQINSSPAKKKVIYCGLDLYKWNPKSIIPGSSLKKELALPEDTMLVAQVGQLTSWKNHQDFITAASFILKKNSNVHFLIVGDDLSRTETEYKTALIHLIKKYGMEKHFTFLGQRNDIIEVISQIDVLIHPAIGEPFGRVIIETMALEKPVVAYSSGGPAEIILNNETGFIVKAGDPLLLAEKAIFLLDNTDVRIRFGKAGRQLIEKKFHLTAQLRAMEELFLTI